MGLERHESSIGDKIAEAFEKLSEGLREIFNKLGELFGYKMDDLTEDQAERLAFCAETEEFRQGNDGCGVFSEVTNPLNESGEPDMRNILSVPNGPKIGDEDIPSFSESNEHDNSWVMHSGEPHWQDHLGYLIPSHQVRFIIRDGYDPERHGTIEDFMQMRCNPPGADNTFLGVEIEGGVHPVLRSRLELVERAMAEQGIKYSEDGTNTIDSIKGFQYRTMGHHVISLHSFGLAIDFSKNRNNVPMHLDGDDTDMITDDALIDRYIAETDYSREFYDLMASLGFIPFGDWVMNRRNGIITRDLMEFRCKPNLDGTVPWNFEQDIHRRA